MSKIGPFLHYEKGFYLLSSAWIREILNLKLLPEERANKDEGLGALFLSVSLTYVHQMLDCKGKSHFAHCRLGHAQHECRGRPL